MRFVVGKPLERWMLLIDLPYRKLALSIIRKRSSPSCSIAPGNFPKSGVVYELLRPLIGGASSASLAAFGQGNTAHFFALACDGP